MTAPDDLDIRDAQRAYDRATTELLVTARTGEPGSRTAPDNVRAIVTPAVVAELRMQAAKFAVYASKTGDLMHDTYEAVAVDLTARAEELTRLAALQ